MTNLSSDMNLAPSMFFCTCEQRLDPSICVANPENHYKDEEDLYMNASICPIHRWNHYCSKCKFGNPNIGLYGYGQYYKENISRGFENQTKYFIHCKSQKQLAEVLPKINPDAEAIEFGWGQIEDFSFLENFPKLKYVAFDSSRVTRIPWDVSKTPNLEQLVVMGKRLFDLSQLKYALNLRSFYFWIATSRMDRQNIASLEPISQLPNLEEVEIQGARLMDENIEHLITIPKLKKLFVSPDMYDTESFARFEAEKFMINEAYGVYSNKEHDDFWGYGNDLPRLRMSKKHPKKIQNYLTGYYDLMNKYKK